MTAIVYNSRSNVIDVALLSDGEPVSLSAVTRVVLTIGETDLDSDSLGLGDGQPFDTSKSVVPTVGPLQGQTVNVLRLSLGGESLTPGVYDGRLVTYDPSNAAGLVWTDALRIKVAA